MDVPRIALVGKEAAILGAVDPHGPQSRIRRVGGIDEQLGVGWVELGMVASGSLPRPRHRPAIGRNTSRSLVHGGVLQLRGRLILLEKYVSLNGHRYCRHGCDSCVDACPNGVEIAEVLRTRMYDLDYKNPEFAKSEYGALENGAEACLHCVNQMCQTACPVGIPIATSTTETAQRLS